MSDKQKRNYGVTEESKIKESLYELGLSSDDIDIILMTHLHFDHACGLTEKNGDEFTSAFKNAKIITSSIEWEEMKNPNIRSKNTYWKENWSPIVEQVQTFSSQIEVLPGIKMVHTGGHSDGHSIITMERNNELLIHMADLMATHAHKNALWVMAYDDYPMDSIEQKQVLLNQGIEKEAWFTFYHDAYFRAIKLGSKGEIISELKRERN
jgi:glyoxylase-like metal-dependent hydrolase (beta-lactamase superfamily II)